LGDVLALQTEIATAVASALKATMLGNEAVKIELGGTHVPTALDAYLRASKAHRNFHDRKGLDAAIAAYTEAIGLDPRYALAFAGRSRSYSDYAGWFATGQSVGHFFERAQADALEAVRLAPELAEGHFALAYFFDNSQDFPRANDAYRSALELAPGSAQVLARYGQFAAYMGQFEAGIGALRRAVLLDPLNPLSHHLLGQGLYASGRYKEAVAAFADTISLDADFTPAYAYRGLAYLGQRDLNRARSSCEARPDAWVTQWCLAVTYDKLGRRADAEASLEKMKSTMGDAEAYQYATIYAQWGNRARSLEWLDTAVRLRDSGLDTLKTDPLMDPLRNEPRFQAIERELKFPD
jgi:tetratricopeptide (TPR) repeat protein